MQQVIDKRHSDRSELLLEVKYEGAGVRAETRISDISERGVFVDAMMPLPAGAMLRLTFTLPDGRLMEVEGRVAHCQPRIGMGIEFINLSPEDLQSISALAHLR